MNKNSEIRAEIKNILTEIGGYNVYASRFLKLPEKKLPAISIYTNEEVSDTTQDQGGQIRLPMTKIVLYAKGSDAIENPTKSVDQVIDEMLEFIQQKLIRKIQTLNKKVFWFRYKGFKTFEDTTGDSIILICETLWEARYHVDTETT